MGRLLALLIVLGCGVAGWLLLSGGLHDLAVVTSATNASVAPDATPAEPVGEPIAAPAADAERAAVPAEVAGAVAERPIPADVIWLEVRVVDAATRAPVPGAEVRWVEGDVEKRLQTLPQAERQALRAEPERVAERFGWRTRAGADGVAKVGADKHGATVHARADGRYAMAYVGGDRDVPAGGWVLELEPDRILRVRVLDAAGQPAIGQPVGIRATAPDGKQLTHRMMVRAQWTRDPDGIAEFRHLQAWHRGGKAQRAAAEWRVFAVVPGLDDVGIAFDVDAPPAEPIELQLPPTGRLAAVLLHEGRPLTHGVTFAAWRVAKDDEEEFEQWDRAAWVAVDADGWARIPRVALGGRIAVTARFRLGSVCKQVAAPLGRDEEIRVELTTAEVLVLSGKLVGPAGGPLANTEVDIEFDAEVCMGSSQIETDDTGRFVLPLHNANSDPRLSRCEFSLLREGEATLRVSVPPRALVRGVNDLGVLQLIAGPFVVAGRLEFDAPPPADRIWFQVEALSDRRGSDGGERWESARSLTPTQHADGAFEVRGEARPVRHRLRFPSREHLPVAPIEFRLGETGLVVPIVLGHRLSATVLVDDDMPLDFVRAVLRPGFAPPPEEREPSSGWSDGFDRHDRYEAQPRGDRLEWAGLPAGTYALEIGVLGLATPIVRIEDVVLPKPAGGDPRLVGVDLRGKLRLVLLEVVDDQGAAVDADGDVLAFAQPQADEHFWKGVMGGAELRLPVVQGPLELTVMAHGYRPQQVQVAAEQVAAGKLTVTVRRWPTAELLLPDLPTLPDGVSLHVTSDPVTPPEGRGRRYSATGYSGNLDDYVEPYGGGEVKDGRAQVTLADGTLRLSACLSAGDRIQRLRSVIPGEILGGEQSGPITVRLSAEEITAALAKLQANEK